MGSHAGSFAYQARLAVLETMAVPVGTCRACERSGMPILLLREAALPQGPSPFDPEQDRVRIDMQPGNYRVLREGFVYVLLDQEIWHAYQVTAEGHMRQYDPYRMPEGTPRPLSQACTGVGHDVRASFIHVDTAVYKEAWIAFSQDRWPEPVLDAYKAQTAPSARFLKVDLTTLRDTPQTVLHGLKFADGFLTDHVWEYRYDGEDFGSRHAVRTRTPRFVPSNDYVDDIAKTQGLPQGVPALALPDPVGAVLEFNQQRHLLINDRLAWAGNAERQYLLFTSAALVQIRELEKTWARTQAVQEVEKEIEYRRQHNDHPVLGTRSHLPPVDVPRETEIAARRITAEYHERLEQRYSEPRRKQFQDMHDKEWQRRQGLIDTMAARYVAWLQSLAWLRIARYDYSATDPHSAAAYTKMVAACLDGGPSEAPPVDGADLGPTQQLWKALLENPDSILYQALLAKNARLLEALRPSFTEGFKANDSGKLYAAIKDVMASQEGEMYLRSTVRDAAGQLQGAMINAMTVLEARAQERLLPVATTVHQAALLLYERTQLLRVQIELTLGEYQELLTQQIRQQYDKAAKETGKKARALIFSGMLTLPGPAQNHIFKATFWVADTAEGLKEKLTAMSNATAETLDAGWRSVVVGIGSFEPKAHVIAGQLRTTAADAKLRAHTAFVGMRGMANMDVALSMGALFFQQDGLKASLDGLDRVAGGRYREAVSSVAASAAGVMGVGIEATGVAIRSVAQAMERVSVAQSHAVNALALGKGLIRFGGVTSALSGAADAVQFGFAAYRNQRAGDFPARNLYSWAAGFALTGGGMGAVAAHYGLSSLMGPLGLAIALGLAAYATSQSAKDHQSTALEQWCRRCYFGVHNESPAIWWNSAKTVITVPPSPTLEAALAKNEAANKDQYTAIGALNAAILGMDVAAEFVNNPQPTLDISSVEPIWSQALVYRIRLPAWDPALSAYAMYVSLKSYAGNHIAVVEQCNASASVQLSGSQKRPSYHVDANATRMPTSMNPLIAGTLILAFLERDIESATIKAKYWPDQTQPELFAELVLTTLR
ncbi:T6SS effector BTH_I2691 family protein [Achromobacter sp. ESBL13]|uniref:T6SS effector BTH_I2691 family protein n=1 Tax=Achromobacter sp. ESBL13 TaxID=3077328 RepID=UPI002FC6C02A